VKSLCASASLFSILLLSSSPLLAQDTSAAAVQPEGKATVVLGSATAPPEWEVRVPISLTLGEGTQVGRFTIRIAYPAQVLRYIKVERSEPLEKAGLDVKAEPVKGAAGADTAHLQIEIVASAKESKPIPSGVIANVVFNVTDKAEPRSWPITVDEVKAWAPSPSSAELKSADGRPGTLTVAPPGLPIFACFFYMH